MANRFGSFASGARLLMGAACVAVAFSACGPGETKPVKKIAEVLAENSSRLLAVPGVVGTAEGLCDRHPCIKVYVARKTPDLERSIPKRLEGYPVVVEEIGPIEAYPEGNRTR